MELAKVLSRYTYIHIHQPTTCYILIQGVLDHPYTPFLSKTKHFREKRFRQKLYGFEGAIRWYHWFDIEESFEGHVKVTSIFLNGTPYIFLHILVVYLDSFPKHYN